jgi:hypothetical protein
MKRSVLAVLAVTLLSAATGCDPKGKDCKMVFEDVRGLDDADLLLLPTQPSEIGPIAKYFDDLRSKLVAGRARVRDHSVQAVLDGLIGLVGERVDLLRGSSWSTPAPSAAASPSDREAALRQAAAAAVQGMLGNGASTEVNRNQHALVANQEALQRMRSETFVGVCP